MMGCGPEQMKALGLTPEQQKQMADIHDRMTRKSIQIEADLEIARLDLQKLVQAEHPDRAQIEAQVDRIAALEAGMKKASIASRLDVRAVLTPEQLHRMCRGPGACEAQEEKPAKPAKPAR